jgi:hypothetical protein
MTWVTWRQQRTEILIAAGIFALVAALLVPTGIHIASVYHHDGLSACANANTRGCSAAVDSFTQRFEALTGMLGWLNLIPGLIGALLAAPLILELETGTFRLAWTQSITRRRWLAGKLGVTVAIALLAALLLTLLMTWWRTPFDHLHGRMTSDVFDFEGIVGFGYVLFALGLSLAVGVVSRRTAPSVIGGFVGYVVARLFVQGALRPHYEAPLTRTWSFLGGRGPDLSKAWILSEQPSDKLGHSAALLGPIPACEHAVNATKRIVSRDCLAQHGAAFNHAVYQPASRFWLFQGIELAIFGGVAFALIAFAAWWVHERVS